MWRIVIINNEPCLTFTTPVHVIPLQGRQSELQMGFLYSRETFQRLQCFLMTIHKSSKSSMWWNKNKRKDVLYFKDLKATKKKKVLSFTFSIYALELFSMKIVVKVGMAWVNRLRYIYMQAVIYNQRGHLLFISAPKALALRNIRLPELPWDFLCNAKIDP